MTITAPADTATTTLTLRLERAIDGFGAVVPHTASNNEDSGVIKAIAVSERGGYASLVATDRYSVGIYTTEEPALGGDVQLLIPAELVKAILAIKPANLRLGRQHVHQYHVRITQLPGSVPDGDAGQLELALLFWPEREGDPVVESTSLFFPATGNFPPVDRLVDQFEAAHGEPMIVALTARHLAKFIATAKAVHEDDSTIRLELSTSAHSEKPGPVKLTIGSRFVGLLQPNLIQY